MRDSSVDVVLTSPFYNTNKKAGKSHTLKNTKVKPDQYNYVRYDVHVDNMTNEQYCLYTGALFTELDRVLKPNGCVLYNLSYGSENTEGMWLTIAHILENTPFTVADSIVWKKHSAFPNTCSPNKLTRVYEFVFVFCRKNELGSFHCNKRVTSHRPTGQAMYESVPNFIYAPNNSRQCPFNKATFSLELCDTLLRLYAPSGGVVFDPFLGSGTTAVAADRLDLSCIGCEISNDQCLFARDWLDEDRQNRALTFAPVETSDLNPRRSQRQQQPQRKSRSQKKKNLVNQKKDPRQIAMDFDDPSNAMRGMYNGSNAKTNERDD